MQKVTGIGGVFFKARDPKAMTSWYQEHLGIRFGDNLYIDFRWINENNPGSTGHTVFSFFSEDTPYFSPSDKPVMINFRVKNLDALLAALKKAGVWVDEKTDTYAYGKFGWCMDPEGNKIELWEPVDDEL
jgi:predicted enzyme related to lactoylglutathione lyase